MNEIFRWFVYILSLSCMSIIIARGEIFDPIKEFIIRKSPTSIDFYISTLIYCPMCLGFWVGLVFSIILDIDILPHDIIVNSFLTGCIISILSISIDKLIWGRTNGYYGPTDAPE